MSVMSWSASHTKTQKLRDSASTNLLTPKISSRVACFLRDVERPSGSEVDSFETRPSTPPCDFSFLMSWPSTMELSSSAQMPKPLALTSSGTVYSLCGARPAAV
jgi:hypothetical protein